MKKIAIDMMGSDNGPLVLLDACKSYLKDHEDVSFLLFGDEKILKEATSGIDRIEVRGTESIIPMEIKPLDFLRSKDSSMYQALAVVKSKEADAVVSAGSTGGFLTGATILLRNIPGVLRAGLCSPFPTKVKGKGTVILDVGANNYNTAEEVYQYAIMGRIYAKSVLGMEDPGTWVLSNGTEEGKGTDEVVGAYKLMKENASLNFKGNVEARNVLDGTHDVVVTPGYAGNIFLKSSEGMASMMNEMIKASFKRNLLTKIGYLFSSKGFKEMKTIMDYRRFGGAILLGINGVVVKAHGNSNEYAFYNAISVADTMIEKNIIDQIQQEFNHD